MSAKIKLIIFISVFSFSCSAQQNEKTEFAVISREEWKAAALVKEMKAQEPQCITIHHTGMPQKPNLSTKEKLQALQNFSQNVSQLADGSIKKAWADVPYHFYIATNGKIAEGRGIEFSGDSNTDYDLRGHVLIVVEGDFNKDKVLLEQWKSLEKLLSYFSSEYGVSSNTITGHKGQAETSCPGKNLYKKLELLENEKNQKAEAEQKSD